MSLDAASFKLRYAEFQPVGDGTVLAALAEAALYCDARLFGPRQDQAVGLYAAHLLSITPFGQAARLKSGESTDTTYLTEWRRVARAVAGGAWATGQVPT